MPGKRTDFATTIGVALLIVGCSGDRSEPQTSMEMSMDVGAVAELVPGDVDTLPRLRFADGQMSLNDRCMVRKAPLNPKMPPVYVSGQPVGFC